jgi:hypothetical protein
MTQMYGSPARILAILACLCSASSVLAAPPAPLRISTWYWLNAAKPGDWETDLRDTHNLGFTDVILCWGLDAAAFGQRTADTHRVLQLANRHGLSGYIMLWHPTHNSLPRNPEFEQVDADGKHRFTFDTFNPEWRRSQWKQYLQKVAAEYKSEPGLAGYVFDDSFQMGPIDYFGGRSGTRKDQSISYNAADIKLFGSNPPRSRADAAWPKWIAARAGWWEEWAQDTASFIRAVDPNPKHELYLEDTDHVLGEEIRNSAGVDFGRVARHFDAVGAYTYSPFDEDSGAQAAEHTRDVLRRTRAVVGPDKEIIYTFWAYNIKEVRNAGPAKLPTIDQIRQIALAAVESGIRHLDLYGYRIGDWDVTPEMWPKMRPGTGPTYPVVGQFPGKFLFDRMEIRSQLPALFADLRQRTR